MALTVRLISQDTVLAVISPSLPNPFLHLRLAIDSLCPWNRALITFHRTFFKPRSSSAKIETARALERQILKMQLEVKGRTIDSEEEDENLTLLSRVENIVQGMIDQKCTDLAFAQVRSQRDFNRKKRMLNRHKERGLELYFKADAIDLKKKVDCAFFTAIKGQINALEHQCLERYWDWISSQAPWDYLQHWKTEVEICQSFSTSLTTTLTHLDPREKPLIKTAYGNLLKTQLFEWVTYHVCKIAQKQMRDKANIRATYMMYKMELLKGPICRMLLWEKLWPLVRRCEKEIQKISLTKKHKKSPLKSARKEWVKKHKEYDPKELRKILVEHRFTRSDQKLIQALSLSMGHDLKRTLLEQEVLDTDMAEDLTTRQDPGLYLRYQLQMRDEMALRLLAPSK